MRHYDRPVFRKLMETMQPSDHLIVWQLTRLERAMFDAIQLGQWLIDHQIHLHLLEHGEASADLDTIMGRIFFAIGSGFAEWEAGQTSSRTKDALHYRRDNAYAYTRVPFGFRIKPLPLAPGQVKPYKIIVPRNSIENDVNVGGAIIDEIVRRIDQGELPYHVAKDLNARKCRCGSKAWAPKRRDGCVDMRRTTGAYRYWKWYQAIVSGRPSSASSSAAFPLPKQARLSLERSEPPKQLTSLAASTPEILCQP